MYIDIHQESTLVAVLVFNPL